jgi:hypothetical protein
MHKELLYKYTIAHTIIHQVTNKGDMYMEHISLSWYDVPEFVFPIIRIVANNEGFKWLSWSHLFESFTVATKILQIRYSIVAILEQLNTLISRNIT